MYHYKQQTKDQAFNDRTITTLREFSKEHEVGDLGSMQTLQVLRDEFVDSETATVLEDIVGAKVEAEEERDQCIADCQVYITPGAAEFASNSSATIAIQLSAIPKYRESPVTLLRNLGKVCANSELRLTQLSQKYDEASAQLRMKALNMIACINHRLTLVPSSVAVDQQNRCTVCGPECNLCHVPKEYSSQEARLLCAAVHRASDLRLQCKNKIRDLWFDRLRFANRSSDPESSEPFDVLRMTSDAFDECAASERQFEHPVLIERDFADGYDVEYFAAILRQKYPNRKVWANPMGAMSVDDLLAELRKRSPFVNALSFQDLVEAVRPSLTRIPRFHFLSHLLEQSKANWHGEIAGNQTLRTPFDIDSCRGVNLVGGASAFSGANVDSLNGTWIRNLFGEKLWFIVPTTSMDPSDWKQFAQAGSSWDLKDKARAIILREGDTLLLPPGVLIIPAVSGTTTTSLQGAQLWDKLRMSDILQTIGWIGRGQKATHDPIAWQWKDMTPLIRTNCPEASAAIDAIEKLACPCRHGKRKANQGCESSSCSSVLQGRRCTPICGEHSKQSDPCLYENLSEGDEDY
ncbi:hypothetical protein LTR95_003045 [Oleoguttula sp. CCFEE 5521]